MMTMVQVSSILWWLLVVEDPTVELPLQDVDMETTKSVITLKNMDHGMARIRQRLHIRSLQGGCYKAHTHSLPFPQQPVHVHGWLGLALLLNTRLSLFTSYNYLTTIWLLLL
jgi:hypothetical protein